MTDQLPAYLAPTFAERKAAREAENKAAQKAVDSDTSEVEDKAVKSAKTATKRSSKK